MPDGMNISGEKAHMIWYRAQVILILLCVGMLVIVLPTVHFAPGDWDAFQRAAISNELYEGMQSPSQHQEAYWIIITVILVGLVILRLWVVRRKRAKKEDLIFYEYPRNPWLAWVLIFFLFATIGGAIWWVRYHPMLVEHMITSKPLFEIPQEPAQSPQLGSAHKNQQILEHAAPLWVVYLLIIAALGAIGWSIWLVFYSQDERGEPDTPSIGQIAAEAIMDLEKDAVLSDVILRCYRDMCSVLSRKVALREEMTAREFAQSLEQVGVRDGEVKKLTTLFERVRYGHHPAGPEERAEAIAALKAIEFQYRRLSNEG
jgi:hypothetical protein